MSLKSNNIRSTQVRERRASRQHATQVRQPSLRRTHNAESIKVPSLQPARKQQAARPARIDHHGAVIFPRTYTRPEPRSNRRDNRYDIAFSVADRDVRVRAPSISLPQINPSRLASGILTLALAFLLYTMWSSSFFTVSGAEGHGNQRIGQTEINAGLHLVGDPIFKAVPAEIKANLLNDYHDLAAVDVKVGFPNKITVTVTERVPVIEWQVNGESFWIDENGIRFPKRGVSQGMITVIATSNPPAQGDEVEGNLTPVFLDPKMVRAIATLYPFVPSGTVMTYDPKYGMGWQEPGSWSVYFGQSTDEIPMKIKVYRAIVDELKRRGIKPELISVEYLRAPFYK
jgi:cell division protein FtsQ